MTRRRRNRVGRRRGRAVAAAGEVTTITGHHDIDVVTIVSGTTQASFQVSPTGIESARLAELADQFRLYRFTRLYVRICGCTIDGGSNATYMSMVGWTQGAMGTIPTLASEVSEMDQVAVRLPDASVPSTLRLTRSILQGVPVWYETEDAAGESLLDTQGQLVFSTVSGTSGLAAAGFLFAFVTWTIELKGRLSPGQSFARRCRRLGFMRMLREVAYNLPDEADAAHVTIDGQPLERLPTHPVAAPVRGSQPFAMGSETSLGEWMHMSPQSRGRCGPPAAVCRSAGRSPGGP
jgi:hypothetical protein